MSVYIGIDNGVTGSIGVITTEFTLFVPQFTRKEQDYTKKKKNITRVNVVQLREFLLQFDGLNPFVYLERPMVNPKMFIATTSALRALEATLNVLEFLKYGHQFLDSKAWQKVLLPQGIKGSPALKKASKDIGIRTFPQHEPIIRKQGDADGLLIAEYCRRMRGYDGANSVD